MDKYVHIHMLILRAHLHSSQVGKQPHQNSTSAFHLVGISEFVLQGPVSHSARTSSHDYTAERKTYSRVNTLNRLNDFLPPSLLLVGEVKVGIRQDDDKDDDQRASHASPKSWLVSWSVLLSTTKASQ